MINKSIDRYATHNPIIMIQVHSEIIYSGIRWGIDRQEVTTKDGLFIQACKGSTLTGATTKDRRENRCRLSMMEGDRTKRHGKQAFRARIVEHKAMTPQGHPLVQVLLAQEYSSLTRL